MAEADWPTEHGCEFEALYELAVDLLQLKDVEALLERVVRAAIALVEAERGFLALGSSDALDFKVVRNWNRRELEEGREPLSRAIVAEALARREPLLVEDALSDPRFAGRDSVQHFQIRSVLAAPLEADGRPIGALVLESSQVKTRFGPRQLGTFRRLMALAGQALEACTRRLVLEQQAAELETDMLLVQRFPGLLTRNRGMLRLLQSVAQAAPTGLPVLLEGPSGSGKELVARAIHRNSPRARRPLVTVNCGALTAALLQSELFGHVRGAFTGATGDKEGLLRKAHGGTLFLDEVGELPRDLQPQLLRALQFGEIQPVGSAEAQTVDVRFVAATNRDLGREVQEGRFREDLYFRLNAMTVRLPTLRDRRGDIVPLFLHFVEREAQGQGRTSPSVDPALERLLESYTWPGNVRELENEARRLVALTPPGEALRQENLSARVLDGLSAPAGPAQDEGLSEREQLELHLRLNGGNRTHAARSLGLSREGLRQRMKRLGLA